MSILFSCDEGWIISHLDYLNKIYENTEDSGNLINLKFKDSFFNINSQFHRLNQINKTDDDIEAKKGKADCKKRKRCKAQLLSKEIKDQNSLIKESYERIINKARQDIFKFDKKDDSNEEAKLESNNFYENEKTNITNFNGENFLEEPVIINFQNEKFVLPKKCSFFGYDVRQIQQKIKLHEFFDLILLDPPWWNKSIRRKKAKFKNNGYQMMYNEEIEKIPIKTLLNSKGIVGVWCTNSPSHMQSILENIFPSWGLKLVAKWFWVKVAKNGKTICDFLDVQGKQPYEILVLGTFQENPSTNIPDKKVFLSVPSSIHSHKPPVTDILKPLLPENPKCLEIFARYLLPGWISWGLEVLKFQQLSLYSSYTVEN